MRPKRDFRSASQDNYESFKQKYPEINITYTTFKKIIYAWNNAFAKHIIDTGNKIKIPHGIGSLTITKYKPRRQRTTAAGNVMPGYVMNGINWQETKKEGKYVYYLNHHSDGFRYYWLWNPHESYIKFSIIWKFEMARVHSRTLANLLKKPDDNHKDLYKQWIFK